MKNRAEFLRVLAETGSPVQARRAVGVGSRAVRKWCEDEAFLEAYNEALDVAHDAIRAKVREMALAGDTSMLALSMKVIEPALRPAGNQVAVQVNAGSAEARFAKLPDDQLIERARQILEDTRMRQEVAAGIVDVEAVEAPGGSYEAAEPSAEDLI